ncbi:putative protein kinase [Polyrhizophydium stewartii]|uniref:Protein-serine/threonine kinase n=1 Tax=Polyrhizophydium stewartii TaxID=2732419 RepID=A0ABR4NGC4_9FUNG
MAAPARRAPQQPQQPQPQPRHLVSATASYANFYHNRVLEKYLKQDTKRVTLRQLTVFGRNLTEDKLLRSANYVRAELPVRLAHRIARFQQLPFVVGTNPHIELVYRMYWDAFETFRALPEITSLEQNRVFCDTVRSLLDTHLVVIPQLAMGIAESEPHLSQHAADKFMNETLRSRIGRRVLAEQHIALSADFEGSRPARDHWIGIVNSKCHARDTIDKCARLAGSIFRNIYGVEPPAITVDGFQDASFIYIPDHIEYILFELIKNSMRFTLEKHAPEIAARGVAAANAQPHYQTASEALASAAAAAAAPSLTPQPSARSSHRPRRELPLEDDDAADADHRRQPAHQAAASEHNPAPGQTLAPAPASAGAPASPLLPAIRITIGQSDTQIMFRISDQGGGIERQIFDHIWSYSHASKRRALAVAAPAHSMPRLAAKLNDPIPSTLHLGLGLPMSRVYANYWGGNISMYTMEGYGTDVYVSISVGNQSENLLDDYKGSGADVHGK